MFSYGCQLLCDLLGSKHTNTEAPIESKESPLEANLCGNWLSAVLLPSTGVSHGGAHRTGCLPKALPDQVGSPVVALWRALFSQLWEGSVQDADNNTDTALLSAFGLCFSGHKAFPTGCSITPILYQHDRAIQLLLAQAGMLRCTPMQEHWLLQMMCSVIFPFFSSCSFMVDYCFTQLWSKSHSHPKLLQSFWLLMQAACQHHSPN